MNLFARCSLFFAATSLLLVLGCASTSKQESTGELLDDSVITSKVKTAIFSEPSLKVLEINVQTTKNVVQLSGTVSTRAEMEGSRGHARGRRRALGHQRPAAEISMRSMRQLAAALAAGITLAAASAQAQLPAAPVPPDVLISTLTGEVLGVIRRDAAAERPTDFALLVETRILPVFDFEHMTRLAAARNWRLASAERWDRRPASGKRIRGRSRRWR